MPLYSDGVLDEVRNSVNLVSLISEYVALKKRGRNYVARCPFHTEKTPSFNVSEEKQIFRCFGCGVGGDIFKFVMQVEQLSFPEAVRFIAERHGIVLPQPAARPESESGSDTETLRRVMEEAGLFFHQTLLEQEEGVARPVLEKIGAEPSLVASRIEDELRAVPKVQGAEPYAANRLMKLFDRAEEEAKRLKDEYVSTEHLLLAASKEKGAAGDALRAAGWT